MTAAAAAAAAWLLLALLPRATDAAVAATFVATADPDWHIPLAPAGAPEPAAADYTLLAAELGRYRAVAAAGGWPAVAAGPPLAAGARDPRLVELRRRLRASGDYTGEMSADPWYFEPGLDPALRRLQRRHGLVEDGVLGEQTLAALNLPVETIIARIEAAMERWRWLPRELGPRYVWVNTARAQLDLVENGASVLAMRVVVGHRERPTPSLAGTLDRVVFNPSWSVPATIAVQDLLPRQQEDPDFLARNRIRVLGHDGAPVHASGIDWSRLGPGRFPYRLVQAAGPGNSLGRIKLSFDNPYDIYLHDTPARGMFGLPTRTLSSGCVRLEDAPGLATRLLSQDRPWTETDTAARTRDTATRTLAVTRGLPVYLVYLAAWRGDDGELRIGRDIYGWDERLLAALHAARGAPATAAQLSARFASARARPSASRDTSRDRRAG
jgi:murein L,D-transpeptidase YcbB/YkuD